MRTLIQVSLMAGIITVFEACNSTNDKSSGMVPSDLSYTSSDSIVFATGVADSGIGPDVTGDVTLFSVSPALPAGLVLDSIEGTIAGRALLASPATDYLVTAKNAAGSTTSKITIAVSTLDTNLSGLVQNIFNNDCIDCHEPGGQGYLATGSGLDLTAGKSYGNLVGHATYELPGQAPFVRVDSGNADGSYLYQKLSSSLPKSGLRMPWDGPPYLTTDEIAIIKRWIQLGVPR